MPAMPAMSAMPGRGGARQFDGVAAAAGQGAQGGGRRAQVVTAIMLRPYSDSARFHQKSQLDSPSWRWLASCD